MLKQVWTDSNYVYAATTSGVNFIDVNTEQSIYFRNDGLSYNSVWANDVYLFAATSTAGIKVIPLDNITATAYTLTTPYLSDNSVNYVHGNTNRMLIATASGIDSIYMPSGYPITAPIAGATKCFITEGGDFYYIIGTTSIGRAKNKRSNWTTPDVVYTVGSNFLINATEIRDIYATHNTSISGDDNTLFIATDVGIYVLDEDSGYCALYTV